MVIGFHSNVKKFKVNAVTLNSALLFNIKMLQ